MGAQVVDYRVSTLVVLCKDCGQDVGLYPSRHKCQTSISRPPVPALPTRYMDSNESLQVPRKPIQSPETSSNGSYSRPISSGSSSSFSGLSSPNLSDTTANSTPSPSSGKWSRFGQRNNNKTDGQQQGEDDSIYFNNFAAHLPEEERQGRKLWGKVRQNEKWKQMTEKNDTSKPTGKLWGKLLLATQNMADKIPSRDDKGPESDDSDWEGETHVSRVIREYYEKKRRPLPHWLRDERTPSSNTAHHPSQPYTSPDDISAKPSSRRRLWDHSQEPSSRERERQELRQQQQQQQQQPEPPQSYRSPREDFEQYDKPVSARQNHRGGYIDRGGYDDFDDGRITSNNPRAYRDHYQQQQQPTSYRTNTRVSQGEPRMDQQRRLHGDISPGRHEQRRNGYENDMDDSYYSGRQAPQDRLRGPRNPPSRPNRYLDTTADYF